jgi:hypothetical protein
MDNIPLKAAITPEMREQGIRLANIMMPRFMKQTREFFQREPGKHMDGSFTTQQQKPHSR